VGELKTVKERESTRSSTQGPEGIEDETTPRILSPHREYTGVPTDPLYVVNSGVHGKGEYTVLRMRPPLPCPKNAQILKKLLYEKTVICD
jgi:hypothetical protein